MPDLGQGGDNRSANCLYVCTFRSHRGISIFAISHYLRAEGGENKTQR